MSRRARLCAGATIVALILTAHDNSSHLLAATDDQSSGLWFVELDGSIETFRRSAGASGVNYTERFVYRRAWRGLSVQTADGSRLASLDGVRAVFPVLTVTAGPVDALHPELAHALAMTGADVAQSELGLTGAGVKVGVIDSGIDYHHPDLGGGFGPGFRVATGFDFVGDRYVTGVGGDLIPHPDPYPDDCSGHGTHVAGIIGANGDPDAGGARGVAPGVTFGAYRVFGCANTTTSDILLAAMERALADGMDVVNMSIGAAFQTWPQYPTALAADALVDAGVVVVMSIGNAGLNGLYSASAPGVARKVIGVAAFDNSHVELALFRVSPDDRAVGFLPAAGAPPPPTSGSGVLARTGLPTTLNDACEPLAAGSLTGRIVLIRRGTCSFYDKSLNAQNAGATAVVLYNNAPGLLSPTVAPPAAAAPPITIPVVAIQLADGVTLNNRIAAGTTTLSWTNERAYFPNPTGGLVSPFSSYGLTADLSLKPNVGAPGGLIRSTLPLEQGAYGVNSGTSMASPHIAGAAALMLEARPAVTPAAVETALMNSADPAVWAGNPALGFLDYVHRQGAGMVDIDDAIRATTAVTPAKISLGEGTGVAPKSATLTITNNGPTAVTYTLSHQPALATTASTFSPGAAASFATVGFSASLVTVPNGASVEVNVTITPPTVQGRVYGGYLAVTPAGAPPLRVPYAGFSGDYQMIQVLTSGVCSPSTFPGIFKLGGQSVCVPASPTTPAITLDIPVTRQAPGATFLVENREDRPVILYHLSHPSRRLEIRAVEQATGRSYLVAFSDYLGRNATAGASLATNGFFTYTWDGKQLFTNAAGRVHRREVPEGAYNLQLVVTKALAEPENPTHLEVWTSPTVVIQR